MKKSIIFLMLLLSINIVNADATFEIEVTVNQKRAFIDDNIQTINDFAPVTFKQKVTFSDLKSEAYGNTGKVYVALGKVYFSDSIFTPELKQMLNDEGMLDTIAKFKNQIVLFDYNSYLKVSAEYILLKDYFLNDKFYSDSYSIGLSNNFENPDESDLGHLTYESIQKALEKGTRFTWTESVKAEVKSINRKRLSFNFTKYNGTAKFIRRIN